MKSVNDRFVRLWVAFDSGEMLQRNVVKGEGMGGEMGALLDKCYAAVSQEHQRAAFHLYWEDGDGRHSTGYASTRDKHDDEHRNEVIRVLNRLLASVGDKPRYMPVTGCNWRQGLSDTAEVLVRVSDRVRDGVLITTVAEFNLGTRAASADAMRAPEEYHRRKQHGIKISLQDLTVGIVSTDERAVLEFREQFGEFVGDRSLWDDMIEAYALYVLDYQDVLLDADRARQFLDAPHAADINLASRITAAGALVLATYQGDLRLNGLCTLSVQAAEAFAIHNGDLHLDGLQELPAPLADALGRHQGYWLSLNGLRRIEAAAAEALAAHQGGWLSLDGIEHLDTAAARALARQKGGLSLNGLLHPQPAVLDALAHHAGGVLHLDSIEDLDPESAAALGRHHSILHINGVHHLEAETARLLGRHHGDLHLDGLEELPAEVANRLAQHESNVLSLNGVKVLSPEAAAALASHEGPIVLNGLSTIDAETANALASHGERLEMNGLEHIDDAAARALSRHRGLYLHLNGITELSESGADALSSYRGAELFLGHLNRVPVQGAVNLMRNQMIYVPDQVEYIATQKNA